MEHLENERYGYLIAWARELGLSQNAMENRLRSLQGVTARDIQGKLRTFYGESQVREACADLLQGLPQADEEGFYTDDQGTHGTLHAWSKCLSVPYYTVAKRMEQEQGRKGKNVQGHLCDFYVEDVVRKACADLLSGLPQADASGFFTVDGTRFGSLSAWSKELGVSALTIERRLDGKKGITGKTSAGNTLTEAFYSETDISQACELIRAAPRAAETGFFVVEGTRYGSVNAWAQELGIGQPTIKRRLNGTPGMDGIGPQGKFEKSGYFDEQTVRERCADLLRELPLTDESGFARVNGERYGSVKAWATELSISPTTVKRRLAEQTSITGKNTQGNLRELYPETMVREVCRDLLSRADNGA